jgi:hypothetical protein
MVPYFQSFFHIKKGSVTAEEEKASTGKAHESERRISAS